MAITLAALAGLAFALARPTPYGNDQSSCDTIYHGYQCQDEISHYWGQYSPYFSVPSDIPDELPHGCSITFAQVLSRHGARDPTASKTAQYNATIYKLQANVKNFTGPYAFLAHYEYTLGADQLTIFGQQELINSGIKYYNRYEPLTSRLAPFVRSSGEARVVESAQNWTQGFHAAKLADRRVQSADTAFPYPIVVIPETDGENNTLNHGWYYVFLLILCNTFENGPDDNIASDGQAQWAAVFIPPIQSRLNAALPGANLTVSETVYMMDLCPFNTVASSNGTISAFCALFTKEEWHQYRCVQYSAPASDPIRATC
ncbi:hypothetical protein B0A55_11608 [Friedmanniomyces simplex]|uniref:3-phytase n=1 Tax=Friedmanniomyces simplex TaxID=329884 RepID=A0A4U0WD58_9PEZI|nr:hypothetical protein B0A55_11608 [Friedmanniomyces simplex]